MASLKSPGNPFGDDADTDEDADPPPATVKSTGNPFAGNGSRKSLDQRSASGDEGRAGQRRRNMQPARLLVVAVPTSLPQVFRGRSFRAIRGLRRQP
jgi:hypothetical protein